MNGMNQKQLLCYIDSVSLVLDDIILYLDTHPNDCEARKAYNIYRDMKNAAIADYNHLYGPLTNCDVTCDSTWKWTQGPWPWQEV